MSKLHEQLEDRISQEQNFASPKNSARKLRAAFEPSRCLSVPTTAINFWEKLGIKCNELRVTHAPVSAGFPRDPRHLLDHRHHIIRTVDRPVISKGMYVPVCVFCGVISCTQSWLSQNWIDLALTRQWSELQGQFACDNGGVWVVWWMGGNFSETFPSRIDSN